MHTAGLNCVLNRFIVAYFLCFGKTCFLFYLFCGMENYREFNRNYPIHICRSLIQYLYMKKKTGIYIAPGRRPWPHELKVAEILVMNGHFVEFLKEGLLPEADIRLDEIEYEMKSPEHFNPNTLEHTIRDALKQSPNIIIDTLRMKKVRTDQIQRFLIRQIYANSRIKRLLLVTKQEKVIDIMALTRYNRSK